MKKMIFLFFGLCLYININAQLVFKTGSFLMEVNANSEIVKLLDLKDNINYAPGLHPGYLVRVKSSGKDLAPLQMNVKKNILYFTFEAGIELHVQADEKNDYLRFELKNPVHPEKIDAVLWGPFNTTINETIGEVVGVTRNKEFAIGIQSLNPKTAGGKINNDE